jgi:hypothetical protein
MELIEIINTIRDAHRVRKWAMGGQAKIDRSLESLVRQTCTEWHPDKADKERKAANKKVKALIEAARAGEPEGAAILDLVLEADEARRPFDRRRARQEKALEEKAGMLPVWQWAKSVPGFGALGVAKLVAAVTSPSAPLAFGSYFKGRENDGVPDETKKGLDGIYSTLGLASYGRPDDGNQYAGSTWKREKWRPRSLTKEEWSDHPFSGESYADLFVIIDSLLRKQLTAPDTLIIRLADGRERKWKAEKVKEESGTIYALTRRGDKESWQPLEGAEIISEAGERRATGAYGEVYLKRRAHTAATHPEWSDMHAHRDAQRVAMKALVADFTAAWLRLTPIAADGARPGAPETAINIPPRSAATEAHGVAG